jgi:hypothetical protein
VKTFDDVLNAGAKYVDQEVCVDGQLISSRRPEDLGAFNQAFATALSTGFVPDEENKLAPLQALELAISREKGAQEFYTGIAGRLQDISVKNKFKYLAEIEKGHFDQLSDLYQKLSGSYEDN